MKLISVIVPVYNAEKFLHKCIDSILRQTYNNFELILVDDGSEDLSGTICKEYEQYDKRVRYVHKANGGVSSARNKGISLARGEYIAFVDSDDFIKEEMLEQLIKSNNADFTMCGYELYDDTSAIIKEQYRCVQLSGDIHDLANGIRDYLTPPFLLGPCFKIFKKSIIDQFNVQFPLELSYGEDAIFVLDYLMHCKTVEILSFIGYTYRKHGSDTLSGKFILNKIDINFRINCMIDNLLRRENIDNRKEIVAERLLECFVEYEKELIRSNLTCKIKQNAFYEKYMMYKNMLGIPNRFAQKIIVCAGNNKLCYPLVFLFKIIDNR